MNLTDLQKKEEKKYIKLLVDSFNMNESDAREIGMHVQVSVVEAYLQAQEDAKKAMPKERRFFPFQAFIAHRNSDIAGWNAYRTQALTNLDALTNVEPV